MTTSKTILVVEDEKDLASMIERHLIRHDFHPIVCNTIQSARMYLETHALPDLLWTDHYLPDGVGLDLITLLREEKQNKNIPIFIVSNTTTKSTYDAFLNEKTLFFLKAELPIRSIIDRMIISLQS